MGEEMKEVIAIIRPEKWRATQVAIFAAGATGASQNRVLGRGQQVGLRYLSRTRTNDVVTMGYLPKRMVRCVVRADHIPAVVENIIRVNKSGNHGDGRIYVCPVGDVVRLRTGERGVVALGE